MIKLIAIVSAVIAVCVSGVVLLDLATFNSDYPIFNRNIHDPDPNGMLLLTLVLPPINGISSFVVRRKTQRFVS
jgi:hypothetical protein